MELEEEARNSVSSGNSTEEIRTSLLAKGYSAGRVESAILAGLAAVRSENEQKNQSLSRKFLLKEMLDRLAFGLSSPQFINILLFQLSSSVFVVGVLSGLRTVISLVLALVFDNLKLRQLSRRVMGFSGILLGFSLIALSLGIMLRSVAIFASAMVVGSIGAVSYGNLYHAMLKESLHKEKRSYLLSRIAYYGLLITAASMLVAAFLLDRPNGYLITFEISAILLILSGYMLSRIPESSTEETTIRLHLRDYGQLIAENKPLLVMLSCGSLVSAVQTIVTAYYGIYIYNAFYTVGFGGFLNVAVIFLLAIAVSVIGPTISRLNAKEYGTFPMLVFGTCLIAITPLTYYYNPSLIAIAVATIVGVIGGSISGYAGGLVIADKIHENDHKSYFAWSGIITLGMLVLLVPAASLFAKVYGLPLLFLASGLCIVLAVPLYFLVVFTRKI